MRNNYERLEIAECKRQHFAGANQLHSERVHRVQTRALCRCILFASNTLKCIHAHTRHVLQTHVCAENGKKKLQRNTGIERVSDILPRVLAELRKEN